jgi:hypothetical protein
MTQTDLLFNPESDDPSRGNQNPESKAAHEVIKPSKKVDRARIWTFIHRSGAQGRTLEQCAWELGKPPSAISGRLTELMVHGMIWKKEEKGRTTSGNACSIYVCK